MSRSPLVAWTVLTAATICQLAHAQQQPADWSGFYVGLDVGYSSDSFDFQDVTESFGTNGFNGKVPDQSFYGDTSALAGGQIGYNKQFSKLVIGLEGDGSWISHEAAFQGDLFFLNNPFPFGSVVHASHSGKLDFIGSVRMKIGMNWHRLLLYATGGLALGDLTLETNDASFVFGGNPAQVGTGSDSGLAAGWTGGAGVEFRITRTVSIAAEYRHLDLGGSYTPSDQQLFRAHGRLDFSDDEVSLRLNVHLISLFAR
jgi:outer membrane immunogenic protein